MGKDIIQPAELIRQRIDNIRSQLGDSSTYQDTIHILGEMAAFRVGLMAITIEADNRVHPVVKEILKDTMDKMGIDPQKFKENGMKPVEIDDVNLISAQVIRNPRIKPEIKNGFILMRERLGFKRIEE